VRFIWLATVLAEENYSSQAELETLRGENWAKLSQVFNLEKQDPKNIFFPFVDFGLNARIRIA